MPLGYSTGPAQDMIESNAAGGLQAALQQAANTILARQEMQLRMQQLQQNWALAQQERAAQEAWRREQLGMQQGQLGLEREKLGMEKSYREAEAANMKSLAAERRGKTLQSYKDMAKQQQAQNLAVGYARAKTAGNQKLADTFQWRLLASNPAALQDYLSNQARATQMQEIARINSLSRIRTMAASRGFDPDEIEQMVIAAQGDFGMAPITAPPAAVPSYPDEASARAAGHGKGARVKIKGFGLVELQ